MALAIAIFVSLAAGAGLMLLALHIKARLEAQAKELDALRRGRVPDKFLPPDLRESEQAVPRAQTWNRRMNPVAWQDRQESIKRFWMENPQARPE